MCSVNVSNVISLLLRRAMRSPLECQNRSLSTMAQAHRVVGMSSPYSTLNSGFSTPCEARFLGDIRPKALEALEIDTGEFGVEVHRRVSSSPT